MLARQLLARVSWRAALGSLVLLAPQLRRDVVLRAVPLTTIVSLWLICCVSHVHAAVGTKPGHGTVKFKISTIS